MSRTPSSPESVLAASHLPGVLRKFLPVAAALVFAVAIWLLERELGGNHLAEALDYIETLSPADLALGFVFTALSYAALVGYDLLALRYARARLPLATVAKTSFTANALSNNLGFGTLTGGSIRYRFYSAAQLTGAQITTAIAFNVTTFPVGAGVLAGLAMLLSPQLLANYLGLSPLVIAAVGAMLFGIALAPLILSALKLEHLSVGSWRVRLPGPATAASQLGVAVVDFLAAAAALYVFMPSADGFGFLAFLSIYLTALIVAVVSHVPGGLGVFEGVIVALTAQTLNAHEVLGALLAYRMAYYIGPLMLALAWFGVGEFAARRRHLTGIADMAAAQWASIAPPVAAAAVFVAGAVLLISGATPEGTGALDELNDWLPLGIIEGSHLVASVSGLGLLLLSTALLHRVDTAYFATMVLLGVGATASLIKGVDYHEALGLAGVALVLWPARGAFYRRGALTEVYLSRQWLLATAMVIGGSIWMGFFAHRHVEYATELWWQFELDGDAPRFLRASLMVVLIFTLVSARQLLLPRGRAPGLPGPGEIAAAARLVAESVDTSAHLALLGDKALMFNAAGDGFIMYRVQGSAWVAMGDPVAPPQRLAELLWQFREQSDRFGGKCVFYQVKPENLALYADLGLAFYKMGDEARIRLAEFSLEVPARRDLRQTHRRAVREGAVFKILSAPDVAAVLPQLKAVSDAWLLLKNGKEKGFSLGFFDADYLARFPCAVVEVNGEIVAFANLWLAAGKAECSVDLMRHLDTKVPGIMDFLLVEIILWGKAQGYAWFNLGMAPLSGLESRRLGPLWHKLGGLVYRIGNQFYSFRGLRKYKEKFGPEWRPKYLACPGGLALGRVLLDLTAVISSTSKRE